MNWAVLYAGQREMELEAAETAWPPSGPTAESPRQGESVGIRLEQVSKAFGERTVLCDLSIEIAAGQFVAVVGRSGCGKTTLLRMIAGLEPASGGQILVEGNAVAGLRGDVRLLFQEPRLLPWHRVISNVGIARGPDWKALAQTALEDVGLGDRGAEWPATLSGGQRQRVALARALVRRPRCLLMDEPFGALDALTRAEMHQLLLRVRREYGFTAILITHDVREALTLADRIIVLKEGGVGLDLTIDVPQQFRAESPSIPRLEQRILAEV